MNAKEMFEEYGLEYRENFFNNEIEQIIYTCDYNYCPKVIFTLSNKTFKVYFDVDTASNIDMKLLQAINKQIEELRWEIKNEDIK